MMGSVHEDPSPPGGPPSVAGGKPRIPDYRNAELVSRLLAANPPYLYSAPLTPHAFFFSEMLRSFVQARHDSHPQVHPTVPHGHRRSKKRSWNHHKLFNPNETPASKVEWQPRADLWNNRNLNMDDKRKYDFNENKVTLDHAKKTSEKPLELTINKTVPRILQEETAMVSPKETKNAPNEVDKNSVLKEEKNPSLGQQLLATSADASPSDLILPPPPPLWYPPLYPPPYGIDPLNFFIDLRVSGHIYDRKHGSAGKEMPANVNMSASSAYPAEGNVPTPPETFSKEHASNDDSYTAAKDDRLEEKRPARHVSAFSVPKPRDPTNKHLPMNLCSSKFNMKYYDDVDIKNQNIRNTTSTHYVMHNLKKIYEEVSPNNLCDGNESNRSKNEEIDGDASDEELSRRRRKKDLRPAIGFELIVDYVKQGVGKSGNGQNKILNDLSGNTSSDDDVIVEGEDG